MKLTRVPKRCFCEFCSKILVKDRWACVGGFLTLCVECAESMNQPIEGILTKGLSSGSII